MPRLKHKTDSNQGDLVEYFRARGASVAVTSALGKGFPDLVVGYRGISVPVEVKDGDKPPSQRQLSDDETEFMETWKGWVEVVEDEEMAEDLLQAMARVAARAGETTRRNGRARRGFDPGKKND